MRKRQNDKGNKVLLFFYFGLRVFLVGDDMGSTIICNGMLKNIKKRIDGEQSNREGKRGYFSCCAFLRFFILELSTL